MYTKTVHGSHKSKHVRTHSSCLLDSYDSTCQTCHIYKNWKMHQQRGPQKVLVLTHVLQVKTLEECQEGSHSSWTAQAASPIFLENLAA